MNSPPTPPYCGSVAAALHLMNSQIRCSSCREKVYSCLSPCDGCNPTGGWCGRLKIRSLLGNFQPAQHQRLVRAVCIKRKGFFRFLSFIHSFNFWTFRAFRVPKQINDLLMNQFMDINVSKRRSFRLSSFVSLTLCLFDSLSLWLFDSLTLWLFDSPQKPCAVHQRRNKALPFREGLG